MAILDTPTKSLRIVLGEAKGTLDCDILAFWGAQTSTGFVPAANDLVSNGTTAVTVVPAPGAGEQRQVNEVRLFNNDTITHNVTLQFDNGGTIRVVEAAPVLAGGEFLYTPSSTNAASGGGGSAEWNAGTVNAISGNLAISSDTLDLANSISISGTATAAAASISGLVQAGTLASGGDATVTLLLSAGTIEVGSSTPFSAFSTHFSVTSGTLDVTGFGAGSVTSVVSGSGLHAGTITSSGTLLADWNGGTVAAISSNLQISSNTIDLANNISISGTTTAAASIQGQMERTTVNAAAGYVGEYLSDTVIAGSAVALTTGTIATIGSVVLTAGDWDINGQTFLTTGNTLTTINQLQTSINTTAGTLNTTPGLLAQTDLNGITAGSFGLDPEIVIIGNRVTAAGTYYLNCQATFGVGTLAAYGLIQARRR